MRDPNFRVRPSDYMDTALNNAQQGIATRLWTNADDIEYTVSTVSGTQEYSLLSNFGTLQTVTYDGKALIPTTLKELKNTYETFTNWMPTNYYTRPWSIGLYPIPNAVWTLYMLYNSIMPTMTDSIDATLPSYMDRAIICKAASELYGSTNPDKAQFREVQYEKAFNIAFITATRDFNWLVF